MDILYKQNASSVTTSKETARCKLYAKIDEIEVLSQCNPQFNVVAYSNVAHENPNDSYNVNLFN